jgi:hypothetical protein
MTANQLYKLTSPKKNKVKFYLKTKIIQNQFEIRNETTEELIAIFFNQKDANNYFKFINKKNV